MVISMANGRFSVISELVTGYESDSEVTGAVLYMGSGQGREEKIRRLHSSIHR